MVIESANLVNESCMSTASSSLLATPHDESHNLLEVSELDRVDERFESSFQDEERKRIVDHYENRIEEMHRRHVDEIQLLKQNHNDKVSYILFSLCMYSVYFGPIGPEMDLDNTCYFPTLILHTHTMKLYNTKHLLKLIK